MTRDANDPGQTARREFLPEWRHSSMNGKDVSFAQPWIRFGGAKCAKLVVIP